MKICKLEGCDKKHYGKGYCAKHYMQLRTHGKIFRTFKDPNEIIEHSDYAEIVIYNQFKSGKEQTEKCRALIDLEDINKIKDYKWSKTVNGYINCSSPFLALHRIIVACPKGKFVDHINHNTLDNRKSNLRIVTAQQNNMNSKSKGISYNKSKKKWQPQLMCNRKQIWLGRYETKEEAINVRKEAEIKYFGEYRYRGEAL